MGLKAGPFQWVPKSQLVLILVLLTFRNGPSGITLLLTFDDKFHHYSIKNKKNKSMIIVTKKKKGNQSSPYYKQKDKEI